MDDVPENTIPEITRSINESGNSNETIDKLTLELFMNKSTYQKYVSKTNPKKYAETQEYHNNIQTHRSQILELTRDLVENPEMQITSEVNDAFEAYAKAVIRHINQRYIEKQNRFNADDEDDTDEDILFGNIPPNTPPPPTNYPISYWGKNTFHRKK